jgi:hypothetical protein
MSITKPGSKEDECVGEDTITAKTKVRLRPGKLSIEHGLRVMKVSDTMNRPQGGIYMSEVQFLIVCFKAPPKICLAPRKHQNVICA